MDYMGHNEHEVYDEEDYELDEEDEDEGCYCGNCMECLGMSDRDFF